MQALSFYAERDLRIETKERPQIAKPHEVIVQIKAAGICGSDISRYAKLGPHQPGTTYGHEGGGIVVEIGTAVTAFKTGDHVAICPSLHCGKCGQCHAGQLSQCEQLSVIGAKRDGVFADYICVDDHLLISVPETMSFEEVAFVEPTAVVLHGFYRTGIQPGSSVAVMGCGNIGLLAIQWAKVFGATEIHAIDIDDDKLALAVELGATHIYNNKEANTFEQFMHHTKGQGVELVIESAGSIHTSAQVFAYAARKGKVLFLGIPYADITIQREYFEKIVRYELQVFGSWNSISAPFPGKEYATSIHFLNNKDINIEPLITHRAPLSEGTAMFEKIMARKEVIGKIMLYPSTN